MAFTNSVAPLTSKPAPKNDMGRTSDMWAVIPSIAALSADPDLDGGSGYPNFAPQRIILVDIAQAGGLDVVMTDEDGVQFTVRVPADSPLVIDRPIKIIDESASGAVQAIMFWWTGFGGFDLNP